MSEATVSVDVGSVSRVVKDTCDVDVPENAVEGMPSIAASQAAPLDMYSVSRGIKDEEKRIFTPCRIPILRCPG